MSRWQLDPVHSSVQFSARHMMVSNVRGLFRDFSLDVDFDPEHPEQGRVQAVVQAASIDTGATRTCAPLTSSMPSGSRRSSSAAPASSHAPAMSTASTAS